MLGVSFMSFENILKNEHGVVISRKSTDGRASVRLSRGDSTAPSFAPDDRLSTVYGSLVFQARALYPEYDALVSCPVVSLGAGVNFDALLVDFDHGTFGDKVIPALKRDDAVSWQPYIDDYEYAVSLVDNQVRSKCLLLEALYKIYVRLRGKRFDMGKGSPLPSCGYEELGLVIKGDVKKSIRLPGLNDAILEVVRAVHPTGEIVNGEFLLYGSFDPFSLIGGSWDDTLQFGTRVEHAHEPVSIAALAVALSNAQLSSVASHPSPSCSAVDAAVALVDKYRCLDLNSLTPLDRDIYLYGGPIGKAVWEAISKTKKRDMWKLIFPKGFDGDGVEAITRMGEVLKTWTPKTVVVSAGDCIGAAQSTPDTAVHVSWEHVCLLAGGRILSAKNKWEFAMTWQYTV